MFQQKNQQKMQKSEKKSPTPPKKHPSGNPLAEFSVPKAASKPAGRLPPYPQRR